MPRDPGSTSSRLSRSRLRRYPHRCPAVKQESRGAITRTPKPGQSHTWQSSLAEEPPPGHQSQADVLEIPRMAEELSPGHQSQADSKDPIHGRRAITRSPKSGRCQRSHTWRTSQHAAAAEVSPTPELRSHAVIEPVHREAEPDPLSASAARPRAGMPYHHSQERRQPRTCAPAGRHLSP